MVLDQGEEKGRSGERAEGLQATGECEGLGFPMHRLLSIRFGLPFAVRSATKGQDRPHQINGVSMLGPMGR
jgi:hypothetical protein